VKQTSPADVSLIKVQILT